MKEVKESIAMTTAIVNEVQESIMIMNGMKESISIMN